MMYVIDVFVTISQCNDIVLPMPCYDIIVVRSYDSGPKVYKFLHDLYTVDRGILVMANSSNTRGHNLKLSRLTCRSRIRHDYFSQRIAEYWNGLPSDVVNASSVNSFKGRLDKHWKFVFSMELPKRTVTSCY